MYQKMNQLYTRNLKNPEIENLLYGYKRRVGTAGNAISFLKANEQKISKLKQRETNKRTTFKIQIIGKPEKINK